MIAMMFLLNMGLFALAGIAWLMLIQVCREEKELKSRHANAKTSVVEQKS